MLEEQCFLSLSYTTLGGAQNVFKEHSRAECQLYGSPTTGLREVEALTVSGLPVVRGAQWAGEALALSPWKHQLQAADELGLAHTVSWTTADNYKIWTLTCRKK